MVDVLIREASSDDIPLLLADIRESDLHEIKASSRLSPEKALFNSLNRSTHTWSGFADGQLACVLGVGPKSLIDRQGVPWLIGTYAIDEHQITFLKHSKRVLRQMLTVYPSLQNYVDVRNETSIRWLQWLGFTLEPPVPHGPFSLPFHPFSMRVE